MNPDGDLLACGGDMSPDAKNDRVALPLDEYYNLSLQPKAPTIYDITIMLRELIGNGTIQASALRLHFSSTTRKYINVCFQILRACRLIYVAGGNDTHHSQQISWNISLESTLCGSDPPYSVLLTRLLQMRIASYFLRLTKEIVLGAAYLSAEATAKLRSVVLTSGSSGLSFIEAINDQSDLLEILVAHGSTDAFRSELMSRYRGFLRGIYYRASDEFMRHILSELQK